MFQEVRMRRKTRTGLLGAVALWLMPIAVAAQDQVAESQTFVLGTIVIKAEDDQKQGGTSTTVSAEDTLRQNRIMLDDALRSVPGVIASNTGGTRNERVINVRGFDRYQVPLSIDGIRVYLPADNRLDFGRFMTPDLAEIQVQKGYVSVLNGPGGMGGAINLVTRQPSQPFEGEARLGVEAGNRGDITARTGFLSMGTRQQDFWLQGSYLRRDSDGFYLSRDFVPTERQDAGLRENAETEDSRLNLKAGWTPNATDEYVLSYTRQDGEKGAPLNVYRTQRDWTWPDWDLDSLAFYSHTELGNGYLKTRAYYNHFENLLSSWDDPTHTTQVERRAFNSLYKDRAWGVSLEAGTELGADNTLRGALHYRHDRHDSFQYNQPGLVPPPAPEEERSEEETWSVALENTWQARPDLSIVAGLSYDKATVLMADRTADSDGLPIGSSDAVNWQLAAIWQPDTGGEYHASLSSRTRFPTLSNRYSTRFGWAVPNPDLGPERATNFELGYDGEIGPATIKTALFYSKVEDMMQSVPVDVDPEGNTISQSQNVGDGTYKGFEIGANWQLSDRIGLAASYTYLHLSIADPVRADLRATDTPRHNAFLRLDWQALDNLTVSPSVEATSSRLVESADQTGDYTNIAYTRMSGFGLVNLDFDWQATERASVVFGVRNIFDRNYQVAEGYPEPGRSFFLTTRMTF